MRRTILIVEDDHALRDVLVRGLRDEDFDTVAAHEGATALRLATTDICAAVLDIGLPDADGRDVCQAMRANGFLSPVIFLTAHHRLAGFSAGGDDYLPKPFHLAELAARLRAALNRAASPPAATAGAPLLDAVRHTVSVHGTHVDLTPTEFRLLATLMAASGDLVPRRALVRAGWPEGAQVQDNTLDLPDQAAPQTARGGQRPDDQHEPQGRSPPRMNVPHPSLSSASAGRYQAPLARSRTRRTTVSSDHGAPDGPGSSCATPVSASAIQSSSAVGRRYIAGQRPSEREEATGSVGRLTDTQARSQLKYMLLLIRARSPQVRGCGKLTAQGAPTSHVPIISEHDTWISVDPIVGCPANCSYCYLGPLKLKARRPSERVTPGQAVDMLCEYLEVTRGHMGGAIDATPVCLGNYTDMLLTDANRMYFREFASELSLARLSRPLVVVTKGCVPRPLAEALKDLDISIIIFCSQSFHRTTLASRTEKGIILAPDQTFDAGASCRDIPNITMVHFWRPITRQSVPSTDWALQTARRLKNSGFRCSVAIGLSVGVGISQVELVETGLLKASSQTHGEIWDDEVWEDVKCAAEKIEYPIYRSTSCAIALATGKAESLGIWDDRRGAAKQCWPCRCPSAQRVRCSSQTLESKDLEEPLKWLAQQLGHDVSSYQVLSGRRVRVNGEVKQSMISLALHKYQIELLPESIAAERAWLGRFGRKAWQ